MAFHDKNIFQALPLHDMSGVLQSDEYVFNRNVLNTKFELYIHKSVQVSYLENVDRKCLFVTWRKNGRMYAI